MNDIALSLLLAVLAGIAAWFYIQREKRLRAVQPEIEHQAHDMKLAVEYASEQLKVSAFEGRAALLACDLLVEMAKNGHPQALVAMPGLTILLARAADTAEKTAARPTEAHVLDLDAARNKRRP